MADLRAYQPSFVAGELSPSLWGRVDIAKYGSGLQTALNLIIHAHGGASNRAGLEFIREVKTSAQATRLIPFQFNTAQSYVLEFGHLYMRVYRDGGLVLKPDGVTPYELVTPYTAAQVADVVYGQEADVIYLTHQSHPPRKLGRTADNAWTLTVMTFLPGIVPPVLASAVATGNTSGKPGYIATTYQYVVSAIKADTGEESLQSNTGTCVNDLTLAGGINTVTWAAVAGADRYIVYRYDQGVFGYIGGTSGLSLADENITPDLSDTPQAGINPFVGAGNYPAISTFIEQRLAFAASLNNPQAVWLSQSANYENFGYSSPAKASDAVTFRVRARQVNSVRAMIALRGLMLLTSGAEWVVTGGTQSDTIGPNAIKLDNQGYRGCASVQPIVVGNTVLFAQRLGGVIRDFTYDLTTGGYDGADLTILARHLFKGKSIKKWAYAQSPDSIVWVVLSDGSLVSLTYMKEQQVWAWTRHDSAGGFFEDVVCIEEGGEDTPYFLIRRTIGGVQRRYIERLHTRAMGTVADAFFVDSGLTYSGPPTAVLAGLGHLEGETLSALCDGNVVLGLTVTGGAVTLPNPASLVHIGLPITATLQTLALDLGQMPGLGTVQGRMKSVAEVTLRVEETRGIFIGPKDGERGDPGLVEYKQRNTEAWGDAIQLYTGDIRITPAWDWNTHGSMVVKQFDPLPMSVLAIMPDVQVAK
jgi:hypothetical protein